MTQTLSFFFFFYYSDTQLADLGSNVKSLSKAGACLFLKEWHTVMYFVYQISLPGNAHLSSHQFSHAGAYTLERSSIFMGCVPWISDLESTYILVSVQVLLKSVYLCHSVAFIKMLDVLDLLIINHTYIHLATCT